MIYCSSRVQNEGNFIFLYCFAHLDHHWFPDYLLSIYVLNVNNEMVNNLRMELDAKANKEEAEMLRVSNELRATINELKTHQDLH